MAFERVDVKTTMGGYITINKVYKLVITVIKLVNHMKKFWSSQPFTKKAKINLV